MDERRFEEAPSAPYGRFLSKYAIPDPNNPEHFYDYKAAFRAGVEPTPWASLPPEDQEEDIAQAVSGQRTGKPMSEDEAREYYRDAKMWSDEFKKPGHPVPKKEWKTWDESRAIPPKEFREITRNTLSKLKGDTGVGYSGANAEELLGMTAAHETNMGRYMKEPGKSSQRGVMQITDETANDIMRYAGRNPKLLASLNSFRRPGVPLERDLEDNLPLSIAMARIKYAMHPKPIPGARDAQALANYYKLIYNSFSPFAKATAAKAAQNYQRFFRGQ